MLYRFLISVISIHALRGEGDYSNRKSKQINTHFNPRPPWGGRRACENARDILVDFNPRPPWGGRPDADSIYSSHSFYFNPRPPWGGRPIACWYWMTSQQFQSTPSVGRATASPAHQKEWVTISIHALRGEGDLTVVLAAATVSISIHALRGEGDRFFRG